MLSALIGKLSVEKILFANFYLLFYILSSTIQMLGAIIQQPANALALHSFLVEKPNRQPL
jgi:hypothetical protein